MDLRQAVRLEWNPNSSTSPSTSWTKTPPTMSTTTTTMKVMLFRKSQLWNQNCKVRTPTRDKNGISLLFEYYNQVRIKTETEVSKYCFLDRIRIRIIFVFSEWGNTNTNNIINNFSQVFWCLHWILISFSPSLSKFRVDPVESILNHFPSHLISWSNYLVSKMLAVCFTKCTDWATK